jgi:hypothetical protein
VKYTSLTFTIFSAMVGILISGTWSNVNVFAQRSSLPWSPSASLQQSSSDDSGSNTPGWTTLTTAASKPLPIAPQQLARDQEQQPQLLTNSGTEIQGYTLNSPVMAQDKLMYLGYHGGDSANNNDSPAMKTSSSTSDMDHRSSSSDSSSKHNHKPDSNGTLHGNSAAASKSPASPKGHISHSGNGAARDSFFNADTFLNNIDMS